MATWEQTDRAPNAVVRMKGSINFCFCFTVVGAIVLEVLLVLVNRFYINYYLNEAEIFLALHKVLSAVRIPLTDSQKDRSRRTQHAASSRSADSAGV
mgnify:CR=1 FL=1